jgi:two-component system sensor histidine kinase KdpD
VLRLETGSPDQMLASESLRLLEAMANQVAVAIEREKLLQQAQLAQLQVEAEQMRNALLSTVSHDLRTPLTVIAGSASSLLEGEGHLDSQTKQELVQNIYEEARRLDRLVHNLLEMSRLQSGQATINKEWHVVEEVIGCALLQLDSQLQEHPVAINLAPDLPLIHLDALLMERVFLNLIENVVKYTPKGTAVEISGRLENGHLRLEVRDRGPGLPPGLEEKVFEKFYQVAPSRSRGAGLGLTICRSIVEAHGGRIWAANRPNGGVVFTFIIPLGEASPVLAKRLSDESATVAH